MNIKRYLFLLVAILCYHFAIAQHIRVVAPKRVAQGEEFQVEYTVYTQDVRNFKLGSISPGLEKIFGPATSSQSSIRFVDGHTSSSSSVSFSYLFVATRQGKVSISPARIDVGGQQLASTPIHISVVGNVNSSRVSSSGRMSYEDDNEDNSASTEITSKDLFIKVIANKTSVVEQEPVLLTYKVYTTKNLKQLVGKMPDLAGFHVQEIPLPQQKSFHKERLNGRVYNCVTWSEYLMYPQVTGVLKVPAITFKGVIKLNDSGFNPFEAFGIDDSREIRKDIVAQGLSINVNPLPTRPDNFSGGVGKFNISAQLSAKEVKAGDPLSVRVVISGNGNLKLLKQPSIKYPDQFETYDVKVSDKTKLTTNGTEGNMIFDQTIIPKKEGNYVIEPITFTYYNTTQKRYITIQTEKLKINVLKSKSSSVFNDTNSTSNLGDDIRPIKTTSGPYDTFKSDFFGSVLYWLLVVFLGATIGAIAYFFRKGFRNSAVDFTLKRERNANKTASSRLDAAYAMMLKGDNIEFYEEISHALWGYVGDKLHIAVGDLSRDNINDKLSAINIPSDVASKFISALDECEFARYAPGDERGNMQRTYDSAMSAISEIEEVTKKKGKSRSFLFLSLVFASMCMIPALASAQSKSIADKYYKTGHYEDAAKEYEFVLQKEVSANLYYNLGNAYYKQDNISRAVLAYERALRLAPSDEDIKFNLQMAQSKTIDNIAPESQMFFVTWYKSLINLLSIDGWAWLSIFCLISIIIGMMSFLYVKKLNFRKTLTKLLIFPVTLFVLSVFFAVQQKISMSSHDYGIITSPSVVVKLTPDAASKNAFIIHEGTKVKILDKSMDQWCMIKLADGRQGWMEKGLVELI